MRVELLGIVRCPGAGGRHCSRFVGRGRKPA